MALTTPQLSGLWKSTAGCPCLPLQSHEIFPTNQLWMAQGHALCNCFQFCGSAIKAPWTGFHRTVTCCSSKGLFFFHHFGFPLVSAPPHTQPIHIIHIYFSCMTLFMMFPSMHSFLSFVPLFKILNLGFSLAKHPHSTWSAIRCIKATQAVKENIRCKEITERSKPILITDSEDANK